MNTIDIIVSLLLSNENYSIESEILPVLQYVPPYPVPVQSHEYDPGLLVHVPLFWQGVPTEHSSRSRDKANQNKQEQMITCTDKLIRKAD